MTEISRGSKASRTALPDVQAVEVRIIVVDPVPDCHYALQRGKGDIEQMQVAGTEDMVFVMPVTLVGATDGSWDTRGPHVQGARGARFVYINSASMARQEGSCWTRRAKVPLRDLGPMLVGSAVIAATCVEAKISGAASDGGPACASVALLGTGWRAKPA